MFVPLPSPEEPRNGELRALRLSLNTPVVALESLAPGPAAAAIAQFGISDRPRITIGVRSERSGERLFYCEDENSSATPELLLDAALSFAESMGFLFDDDEVETRGDAGPREAAAIWREFAGLTEPAAGGGSEELWLEEVAAPTARGRRSAPPTPSRARSAPEPATAPDATASRQPPTPLPRMSLTKFRRRSGARDTEAERLQDPRLALLCRF